jgi:hypothetical protein
VSSQSVEPEECLRALADEAVRQAEGGALVLHCTLGVRAAANAFVALGLIPEQLADKVLFDYQESLQSRSLGTAWGLTEGELPARSGAADVWAAHATGPSPLASVPTAMAPAGISFPATISGLRADLRFEWVKLAEGQWRISFRASADDPGGQPDRPSVVMREALGLLRVTDDTGHRYRPRVEGVTWERVGTGRQEWRGDLVADARPATPAGDADAGPAAPPDWLEITSHESGTTERVTLTTSARPGRPPAVATAVTRWAHPAEGYLDLLARVGMVKVGWTEIEAAKTAEIVAMVADCLLAVGALPVDSPVLRELPPASAAWRIALAARWARRAHLGATSGAGQGGHQILLTSLPLEHATVVIESVSAAGGLVGVALHATPWVAETPWPLIAPSLAVHATDAAGGAYEGILEGFAPARAGAEAAGTFWLWPPVPDSVTAIDVTVATLWEAATATITLPARERDGAETSGR